MGEFIDRLKGKTKQAVGKVFGNKKLQSEGVADQAKGEVKGPFEEAKTDFKRAVRQGEEDSRRSNEPTSTPPNTSNR